MQRRLAVVRDLRKLSEQYRTGLSASVLEQPRTPMWMLLGRHGSTTSTVRADQPFPTQTGIFKARTTRHCFKRDVKGSSNAGFPFRPGVTSFNYSLPTLQAIKRQLDRSTFRSTTPQLLPW